MITKKTSKPVLQKKKIGSLERSVLVKGKPSVMINNMDEAKLNKSMHYSTMEGAFSSASSSIINAYTVPFALALKATNAEIGLLRSVEQLAATASQVPGALLTRYMNRKTIWSISTFLAKFLWLFIAAIPFLGLENPISFLILFIGITAFFGSMRSPAWTSLIGDIVPENRRGKYFGWRNMITGFAGLGVILIIGYILDAFGFSFIFTLSAALGLLSILFFAKMYEPKFRNVYHYKHSVSFSFSNIRTSFSANKNFYYFTFFLSLMGFGVMVATPFFIVYMLNSLNIGYFWFSIIVAVGALVSIIFQPYWGRFCDSFGERNIIVVTGILVCFVPLFYMFAANVAHILMIEVFSSFAWAGFDLAAFNLLLGVTPADKRPGFVANHNVIKGISVVLGALFGGFLAQSVSHSTFMWFAGLQIVFLASFIIRVASLVLLPKILSAEYEKAPPVSYVFWRTVAVEPAKGLAHAVEYTFTHPHDIEEAAKKKIGWEFAKIKGRLNGA
ncbi:MAG: MFS transporter [Candidatus Aenigmatarchaeota archaeon]